MGRTNVVLDDALVERVMRLYRHDPAALAYEAHLQGRKNSAEEVMHPRPSTPRFGTPNDLVQAWKDHVLRAIPRVARCARPVVRT